MFVSNLPKKMFVNVFPPHIHITSKYARTITSHLLGVNVRCLGNIKWKFIASFVEKPDFGSTKHGPKNSSSSSIALSSGVRFLVFPHLSAPVGNSINDIPLCHYLTMGFWKNSIHDTPLFHHLTLESWDNSINDILLISLFHAGVLEELY